MFHISVCALHTAGESTYTKNLNFILTSFYKGLDSHLFTNSVCYLQYLRMMLLSLPIDTVEVYIIYGLAYCCQPFKLALFILTQYPLLHCYIAY